MSDKTDGIVSAGGTLDAIVRQLFEVSWGQARGWIETGKICVDDKVVTEQRALIRTGARVELKMNAPRKPRLNAGGSESVTIARDRIVFVDSQIVVVDKPSGISSVPFEGKGAARSASSGREPVERGTLVDALSALLGQRKLEVVHRIDKETSGLIVFARTPDAARGLANQFRFHTVHRRYWALVQGQARASTIRSFLISDRGDGLRGTAPRGWRVVPGEGQEAVTHVSVIEELAGPTLVECRLETGRTHQIRIHLSESGHPLLGERLYVRDYTGPVIPAPRVMLHAAELGFKHPGSGAEMMWKSEVPGDFGLLVAQLRKEKG